MATLTLRTTKGSPLTNAEVDGNFTAINTEVAAITTEVGTKLNSASYTAADVLNKIKTVDGIGSGLDADLLDGMSVATANTVSTIVARDASGNFSAGTIAADLTGNVTGNATTASSADTLTTARTIGGVSFNGSANINLPGVNAVGNQNTTGTAANVTGIVSIGNGGTGTTTPSLVAGTNISITGLWPNQTINNTQVPSFAALTDSIEAGLTVDQFYLQATTRLNITANETTSYSIDQYDTVNPAINITSGTTIAFNLNAVGHPFLIRTSAGVDYNDGLIHVTPAGVVTTGANAQGKVSGTLYWKIPNNVSGDYQYICQNHQNMAGVIKVSSTTTGGFSNTKAFFFSGF